MTTRTTETSPGTIRASKIPILTREMMIKTMAASNEYHGVYRLIKPRSSRGTDTAFMTAQAIYNTVTHCGSLPTPCSASRMIMARKIATTETIIPSTLIVSVSILYIHTIIQYFLNLCHGNIFLVSLWAVRYSVVYKQEV